MDKKPLIEEYVLQNGLKRYMFRAYLGVDPSTGKAKNTTRRGFKTKKEANLAYSKLILEVEEDGFKTIKYNRFSDVYDLWMDQYKNTIKESTLVNTKILFNKHILPLFGNMKLKDITIPYCQRAVNEWYQDVVNYGTIKQYVSRILDFAVALECIKSNPMAKVQTPRKKKVVKVEAEEKFYTKEELEDFFRLMIDNQNLKHHVFFRLLAFTGARKSEVSALTWRDINFEAKTITIDKTLIEGEDTVKVSSTKTESSNRVISIDEQTLSLLKKWRSQQASDHFKLGLTAIAGKHQIVFPASREYKYMHIKIPNDWLKSFYKRHPDFKQITVHGFRHTHCSLLFEAGASIKEVQERLGHSNIQTTMNIYAHVSKKAKEELAQNFARYVGF